jgi:hypothetical protein
MLAVDGFVQRRKGEGYVSLVSIPLSHLPKLHLIIQTKVDADFQIKPSLRETGWSITMWRVQLTWYSIDMIWRFCDDDKLVQLWRSWILSIVSPLSKVSFCLRLKKNLPERGTSSIYWTQLSRCYLKAETESSLRNVVFWNINRTTFWTNTRRWVTSKNVIFVWYSVVSEPNNFSVSNKIILLAGWVCILFYSSLSMWTAYRRMEGWLMNDDFEGFKRILDMNVEIQTQYILNTFEDPYRCPNPLDSLLSLRSSNAPGLMNGSRVTCFIFLLKFQQKFHCVMKWCYTRWKLKGSHVIC